MSNDLTMGIVSTGMYLPETVMTAPSSPGNQPSEVRKKLSPTKPKLAVIRPSTATMTNMEPTTFGLLEGLFFFYLGGGG